MSGAGSYILKRAGKVRISDVKLLATSGKARLEKITVIRAKYNRIVFAKKPRFNDIIKYDNAGGKYLAADAVKMTKTYTDEMVAFEKYVQKETSDPTLGNLWKLCVAVATLLAAIATQEEKQDQMLKQLEDDLNDDVARLSQDQVALDDMKVDKEKLEKDAQTWLGSVVDMVTGQRAILAKQMAELETEIDDLTTKIILERKQISQIKLQRLMMEIEL